jgi:hypothetical protein
MYLRDFEKCSSFYPSKMIQDLEFCLARWSSLYFNMMLMCNNAISVLEILSKISGSWFIRV